MSGFPSYNNNSFLINSVNQFSLSVFNPYSLYYYTVTIITPLIPEGEQQVPDVPEVTVDDLLKWCGQFYEINDENHTLYALAQALLDIGKEYVDHVFTGEKDFKRAVSLYAGHYLELHLKMLKDEANNASFNKENTDKEIKMELPMYAKEDFRQTLAGQMFWSVYGSKSRFTGTWGAV